MATVTIVTIGDELTQGRLVDTNAAEISARLEGRGFSVIEHVAVGRGNEIAPHIGFAVAGPDGPCAQPRRGVHGCRQLLPEVSDLGCQIFLLCDEAEELAHNPQAFQSAIHIGIDQAVNRLIQSF